MKEKKIRIKHKKDAFIYLPDKLDPETETYKDIRTWNYEFHVAELEDLKVGACHYIHKYKVKLEYMGVEP